MKSRIPLTLLALILPLLTACTSPVEKYRKEGIALYNQQQFDPALQTLNKALAADQFDAQSNAYAGLIYYRSNNFVQAAYHFNVALQADPSSEEAKDGLTATYIKQGKPDQALDALERSAELSMKVRDPRSDKMNMGRRYQKQTEERLYTGKVGDRLRIGKAYEKLGDYDNALVYYKKALELSPNHGPALMAIATLAEKANNPVETREYLRRAYLADPATPGLTEAMTRNNLAISEVLGPGTPTPANTAIIPPPSGK